MNLRPTRLSRAVPGWDGIPAPESIHVIGVLPGEGIGPEVIAASLAVLSAITEHTPLRFDVRVGGQIGLPAERETGRVLPAATESFCRSVFADNGALLCGPGGGRFVYELRTRFDLFCKMVPIQPMPALSDAGVLRPSAVTGVDMLIIRENVGGLYLGDYGEDGHAAYHRCRYDAAQVKRILSAGIGVARLRRGRLCVVLKPYGVPSISRLWQEQLDALSAGTGVEVRILEVDTACYLLTADARSFDVVVAPNMFADVLADGAALLLGSRGLSYSANFSASRVAVYQTGHGAARDLAGCDRANPLGQILSLAMMLHESFGLGGLSGIIRTAIAGVLSAGWRTPDIMAPGCRSVGTRELGERVADAVREDLARQAGDSAATTAAGLS